MSLISLLKHIFPSHYSITHQLQTVHRIVSKSQRGSLEELNLLSTTNCLFIFKGMIHSSRIWKYDQEETTIVCIEVLLITIQADQSSDQEIAFALDSKHLIDDSNYYHLIDFLVSTWVGYFSHYANKVKCEGLEILQKNIHLRWNMTPTSPCVA